MAIATPDVEVPTAHRHRDFVQKVAGTLPYADDWALPGMLHGVVVRASVPCARIVGVDTSAALEVPGVHAVLTAADIPCNAIVDEASGVGLDAVAQPVLAADRVRYDGEPVALVAAETPGAALDASALVAVDYDEEPGVFAPEDALAPGAPLVHDQGNECVRWHIERGDVERAMGRAHAVVSATYQTQRVDHAYLEPEAGIGWIDNDGVLTLRVATQVIEHARELAEILGLPHSRVRVIAAYMGGGFGGKEDMTVEPFLAALVWRTRRPVRMVWSRQESLLARQKRHPLTMRYRTGVTRDGEIVAQDIRILGDAGAYPLLSSRVLFAAAVDSTGPYRVEAVRVESVAAYTNNVPCSAFRGFGGMQVHFAYESQMDAIARELGMDPAEVRARNFVSRGDRRATGEPLETDAAVERCLTTAIEALGPRPAPRQGVRVGRGYACGMQHYGRALFFADRASAWIGLEQDGTVVVRAGVTDLGAGQAASLADIASEVLGVTIDRTSVHIGDSALTPLCGGTFATRQLYMSGNAVLKVAMALREKLLPIAAELLEAPPEALELADNRVAVEGYAGRSIAMAELARAAEARGVLLYCHDTFETGAGAFDPTTGQGRTFPDYTYGAHAVDVEVDEDTGRVRILKYVACHDVGRAIDMQRVEGQIQGAVAQGIGYALSEEVPVDAGVTTSTLLADYLLPSALDLPDIAAIGLEIHPGKGPLGARGIGEPPIGPPAPALASAIEDAIGVRLRCLPMTAERVHVALRQASGAARALVRLRSPGDVDGPAPGDAPRRFHATMPGYAATPLRAAPAAAAELGVAEVLVKDESSRFGLPSFKVLGASWALCRAVAARRVPGHEDVEAFEALRRAVDELRPLSLCAATDGNHGRAVAYLARVLGIDAAIYVPHGTAQARIDAIAGEGAVVTVVDGGYDDAVALAAGQASARCLVIADTATAGHVDAPAWVIDGYSTMLAEVEEAIAQGRAARPNLVVVPTGVGALAAAVVRHFWSASGPRPRIVAVEPVSAACVLESVAHGARVSLQHPQTSMMAGLNCGTPSSAAWPAVSRGIDVYLAASELRVPDAMRLLASDGIEAGETGAAALAGMLELVSGRCEEARTALGVGAPSRVLLLCTEGATDPEAYRRWTSMP